MGFTQPVTQKTHPRDVSPGKDISGSYKYRNPRHLIDTHEKRDSLPPDKNLLPLEIILNQREKECSYCENFEQIP